REVDERSGQHPERGAADGRVSQVPNDGAAEDQDQRGTDPVRYPAPRHLANELPNRSRDDSRGPSYGRAGSLDLSILTVCVCASRGLDLGGSVDLFPWKHSASARFTLSLRCWSSCQRRPTRRLRRRTYSSCAARPRINQAVESSSMASRPRFERRLPVRSS